MAGSAAVIPGLWITSKDTARTETFETHANTCENTFLRTHKRTHSKDTARPETHETLCEEDHLDTSLLCQHKRTHSEDTGLRLMRLYVRRIT